MLWFNFIIGLNFMFLVSNSLSYINIPQTKEKIKLKHDVLNHKEIYSRDEERIIKVSKPHQSFLGSKKICSATFISVTTDEESIIMCMPPSSRSGCRSCYRLDPASYKIDQSSVAQFLLPWGRFLESSDN